MGQSMNGSGVHYGAKYEWVRVVLWGKVRVGQAASYGAKYEWVRGAQ